MENYKKGLFFFLILGFINIQESCKSRSVESNLMETSKMAPSLVHGADLCNGNESYSPFSLEQLTTMPTIEIVKAIFPNINNLIPPGRVAPNIRLEICFTSDETPILKGMTYVEMEQQGKIELLAPVGEAIGLYDALFQKMENLSLEFESETGQRFILKGFKENDISFVVVAHEDSNPIAGRMVYGDFQRNTSCPLGMVERKIVWSFDQVSINAELCAWGFGMGTGTIYYQYNRLKIIDRSAELEDSLRGKEFVLESELQDPSVFKYRQNHHNSCDAVDIKLYHATYALTGAQTFTMAATDCDSFGNALARSKLVEDTLTLKEKSKFHYRYTDKEWKTGFFEQRRLVPLQ